MSDITFKSIIKGKEDVLEEKLDTDHGLLAKLVALGVITRLHRKAIEEAPKLEKAGKLLDILLMRDEKSVLAFLRALTENDQSHVALMLHNEASESQPPTKRSDIQDTESGSSRPFRPSAQSSYTFKDVGAVMKDNFLFRLKEALKEMIDPDFTLPDKLLSELVLTDAERQDVEARSSVQERNYVLLNFVLQKNEAAQRRFIACLNDTDQRHVVNFVNCDGEWETVEKLYGENRPLSNDQRSIIDYNRHQLVRQIDPECGIIDQLHDSKCFNQLHKDHIKSGKTSIKKAGLLLDIMRRRSLDDFKKLAALLLKYGCPLLAQLLMKGGVIANMTAYADESSKQPESSIIAACKGLGAWLPVLGVKFLAVVLKNSLAVLFICESQTGLKNLGNLYVSGELRSILEERFTSWLKADDPQATVHIKELVWELSDYCRCSLYFNPVLQLDPSHTLEAPFTSTSELSDLPLELLEIVLMRTYLMLYSTDKSRHSERQAFIMLASVCSEWRYGLTGWPQSPTPLWVRHQLKKLIERSSRPFRPSAQLSHTFKDVGWVEGVTQLHDVVYIVCLGSSTISRFDARTHQRLTDIDVKDLRQPWDIVACEQTSQIYVADRYCIWRVSSDGEDIKLWLPKSPLVTFEPWSLSVTSTRLLVTSCFTRQLIQFDEVGDELRRVQLPDDMLPWHAVESPTGTFIVSRYNEQLDQGDVSEVKTGGEVLRQFSGSHLLSLRRTRHVAVDSHGNILVADADNRRILLLDAHLTLLRVIIDKHQLNDKRPSRLCYIEQSGQLLVALIGGDVVDVAVFDVL